MACDEDGWESVPESLLDPNANCGDDDDEWGDGGTSLAPLDAGSTPLLFTPQRGNESPPRVEVTRDKTDVLVGILNPQMNSARSYSDAELAEHMDLILIDFFTGLGCAMARNRDESIVLLLDHHWDTLALLSGDMTEQAIDQMRIDSGIDPSPANDPPTSPGEDCLVCWAEPADYALACGHHHCATCWKDHIHSNVCIEANLEVPCMSRNCNMLMPMSFIEAHACDCKVSSAATLQKALVRNYAKARQIVQCSSLTCALWVDNVRKDQAVTCRCGFKFCFKCRLADREFEDHSPVTCQQRLDWGSKEASMQEDASMGYIKKHARQCPFCHSYQIRVEGTCNHIICGRDTHGDGQTVRGCGKAWCWFCRRPWSECGYGCGRRATEQEEQEAENNEKFLMFFSRYHDTHAWLKTGVPKLVQTLYDRLDEYLSDPSGFPKLVASDTEELLRTAVAAEISGKQLLLNTYILSYFMKASPGLAMFQDCQSKLEQLSDRILKLNRLPLKDLDCEDLRRARDESNNWNQAMSKTIAQLVDAQRAIEEEEKARALAAERAKEAKKARKTSSRSSSSRAAASSSSTTGTTAAASSSTTTTNTNTQADALQSSDEGSPARSGFRRLLRRFI